MTGIKILGNLNFKNNIIIKSKNIYFLTKVIIIDFVDNQDLIFWRNINFKIDNYDISTSGFCIIYEENSTVICENNIIGGH